MAEAEPDISPAEDDSEEEEDEDEEVGTSTGGRGDDGDKFFIHQRPNPKVKYPTAVLYCEVCDGWPLEYVEFHPHHEKAKAWMADNLTEDMKRLYLADGEIEGTGGEETKKKRQTRGGRGVIKTKKKQEKPQRITLARAPRGKKKFVTVITGLGTYDIELRGASKHFAGVFACGSSVTGDDEIVIQGDCKDELFDLLTEKWPQIDEDSIDDLGNQKRS